MLPNLASCNREIGKYTVFFILVTSVSLQTFSFAVIPKFQGAGKKISLQIGVQVTVMTFCTLPSTITYTTEQNLGKLTCLTLLPICTFH